MATIFVWFASALLLITTAFSYRELSGLSAHDGRGDSDQLRESLYLPHSKAVVAISFGYQNALADLFWFKTISYFGKHYVEDRNYRWLSHMCDLVTTLNPHHIEAYRFCSLMLAWEAGAPRESVALLSKAVLAQPDNWLFRYLRGFNYMYFLEDRSSAAEDFAAAAKLPDAPAIVARLAAKQLVEGDDPKAAIHFLDGMLAITTDPSAQSALQAKRKELLRELQSVPSTGEESFNGNMMED